MTLNKKRKQPFVLALITMSSLLFLDCSVKDILDYNSIPVANFEMSNSKPVIGDLINFTDTSTDDDGTINSWLWNFGDGAVSTEKNAAHTFAIATTYTVSLTVKDNKGAEIKKEIALVVSNPKVINIVPVSAFKVVSPQVQKGAEVVFTDASTDVDGTITTTSWNFGDGNTSTSQNPKHFYATTGTFTVTLTVTDNAGESSSSTSNLTVWGDKWSFLTGGEIRSSTPAIGVDGTIYIGSDDDKLYAINPDGTKKWEFLTGGNIATSPTIGADGTIYCGSDDDFFYAINPDGTRKWSFNTGGNVNTTSAALDPNGLSIYVGSASDKIFSLNTNTGAQNWVYTVDGDVLSLAAGLNNTLYFSHNGGRNLVSLNTTNSTLKWRFPHGMFVGGSMAIDDQNAVYFLGDGTNDLIYAINADGTQKWSVTLTGSASRGGIVIADGKVYASTKEITNHLKVLNIADGSTIWNYTTGKDLSATPLVDKDGNLYIGSFDENFYVLDANGNLKYKFKTGGSIWSSATMANDGTVYFGSYDRKMYAMDFFSAGRSTSTWPTLGKNAQHVNHK